MGYQEDLDKANKAIQRNPKDADAYRDRGGLYGAMGDSQQSISDFSMAITLAPSYGAYYGRGFEYGKAGDFEQAIEDFNMALELEPSDPAGARLSLNEAHKGNRSHFGG
ncbi:MAG: tetratricopeptide repeat protein [Treponema sp.]|jgi:tetratricopeptide (TPR) repeat protein|nr:tetratricopeptide repeat protein [Treponema sp.]